MIPTSKQNTTTWKKQNEKIKRQIKQHNKSLKQRTSVPKN
jgi:hypothetical protein